MDIQEIKKNIRSLYDELKKEADGKTISPSITYISPSAVSYCNKANELVEEVKKYAELDKDFNINPILHTLNKEVSYVCNYDSKEKSKKKQRENLEGLMRTATYQLYLDLSSLLDDEDAT